MTIPRRPRTDVRVVRKADASPEAQRAASFVRLVIALGLASDQEIVTFSETASGYEDLRVIPFNPDSPEE